MAATDTDDTSLIYSLGGTDAASFDIVSTTGQLQTKTALNYEAKRRYTVTVFVRDGKNNDGEADTATDDTITVTIDVVNLDEAGTVTLSGTPAQAGRQLTAMLSDPDGGLSGISWQWERSSDQSTWTDITGETSTQYTPVAGDVGDYLRATARYTDGQGSGKSAAAVTAQVAAAPVVELRLSPPRIDEDGGMSTGVSTVTAHLLNNRTSPAKTTVRVTVTALAPAQAGDFTLSGNQLTITAGALASTEMVTLTARNNNVDAPDKTVTVSGTATNSDGVTGPADKTLTIEDDDPAPSVELVLSPRQISETDQVSTVRAELSHPSSADTTVTVSAAAVRPAVAGDFMLSTNATLTILAGAMASSGTAVTLTSVDNDTDAPDKQVTVSGTATNTHGIAGNPADATLLITDDEGTPRVTLTLSETQIDESGADNSATLTVTLSHASSAATTVTVTADPADAVTFSPGATLTIRAGDTEGTVTLTAVDNETDGPETKRVTISADADNDQGVTDPANKMLTIADDDNPPVVTLELSATPIDENGGQSTLTARLDRASSEQIVVTVAPAPAYELSTPRTLTIPAGETASTGTPVTLTAKDNAIDAADAEIMVEGTASGGLTVEAAELTITDDDTRGVTVSTDTLSIKEGDTGTYTVVLDSQPTATVTVTLAVAQTDDAVSTNQASLTFAPGNWNTAQTVTVRAADDDVTNDPPHRATIEHTVTGGDYGENNVPAASVSVTVTDDESPSSAVTLSVNPEAVTEGTSNRTVTVTGELDGAPRGTDTTVTISVTSGSGDEAAEEGTDFDAVADFTLTITAGQPSGTATFTLTATDDAIDEPDETVTVDGTVTGLTVNSTTLTITDNDPPPTVTLEVADNSITESGVDSSTTVRATLNHPSSEVTTVEVTATAVPPAADDDFTLSGASLTIPAGQTQSGGSATLTARDNAEDEADKRVRVTARATNAQGVRATTVAAVSVTITDDDPPEVKGEETPTYVEGGTGPVATYTASNPANARLTWSLDGTDKDAFTIPNGVLRFRQSPDYEDPPDKEYDITVQASDGTVTGELPVLVTVEDALGTVRLSASQPRVGSALTATVSDPDGVDAATTDWCWERSLLSNFPSGETDEITCTSTNQTTTATYTPVDDDLGHYLRATVTYADNQGTPKREAVEAVTTNTVLARGGGGRDSGGGGGSGGGGRGGGGGGGAPACTQDDVHGNSPTQATAVALSAVTAGAICPATDVDYFTVTAPGRGLLFVETFGGASPRGTLWQDGAVLAPGPRPGTRLGARVEAGPVVVALQGQGGATGTYEVVITFVQGVLENPGPASFQSGVGVLSGWVCEADMVEIALNGVPQEAAYGTERLDTQGVCGDTDNGFGLLFNWNLLGDGEHTMVALVDGVELGRVTVTVTTLGAEFLRGVEGECVAADFPSAGETVRLVWQEAQQNFVLTEGSAPTGASSSGTTGVGLLENPSPRSFQSGIGVLSGWVCEAEEVVITIGDLAPQVAGYGTERLDTLAVCGDTANGFGLLFNWNLLGDGAHEVVASADGVELGRTTVRVTTLGEEFVRGAVGECVVADFPHPGAAVTLTWQESSQNFVITDLE